MTDKKPRKRLSQSRAAIRARARRASKSAPAESQPQQPSPFLQEPLHPVRIEQPADLPLPDDHWICHWSGRYCFQILVPGTGIHAEGMLFATIEQATIDAWSHALGREKVARKGEVEGSEARHRSTFAELEQTRAEVARYRRALQQIDEIANGKRRTGGEFGGVPEQVVADVGHALRSESARRPSDLASAYASLWLPGYKP